MSSASQTYRAVGADAYAFAIEPPGEPPAKSDLFFKAVQVAHRRTGEKANIVYP
jgi:hypothetical protein